MTIKKATLTMTCDNSFLAFVNGKKVGEGDDWQKAHAFDVTDKLVKGANILAVAGTNEGGPAGLVGALKIEFTTGDPQLVTTDKEWVATDKKPADGWEKPGFDPKDWKKVKVEGDYGMDPWGNQVELP